MIKCPNCKIGILALDDDGYEKRYTCVSCARQFDLALKPKRVIAKEFQKRYGISLSHHKEV